MYERGASLKYGARLFYLVAAAYVGRAGVCLALERPLHWAHRGRGLIGMSLARADLDAV